jgi:ketosteroid isomerase-like protein
MIRLVLTFLAVAALAAHGAPQQSGAATDEHVLAALQQTLAKAWVGGDRTTIERIIAPDWRSTGPDGRMTDRAGVLADVFEARLHRIQRVDIDDVNVRVFGDAAVVTGRTHGTGEVRGTPYDVVIRFTDTFVRRDGRWQGVASHASLLESRQ